MSAITQLGMGGGPASGQSYSGATPEGPGYTIYLENHELHSGDTSSGATAGPVYPNATPTTFALDTTGLLGVNQTAFIAVKARSAEGVESDFSNILIIETDGSSNPLQLSEAPFNVNVIHFEYVSARYTKCEWDFYVNDKPAPDIFKVYLDGSPVSDTITYVAGTSHYEWDGTPEGGLLSIEPHTIVVSACITSYVIDVEHKSEVVWFTPPSFSYPAVEAVTALQI